MLATLISGERVLDGAQLERRVGKIAGRLQQFARAEGAVICLLMRNDFAPIELALAADRAGLAAVSLDWHRPLGEFSRFLKDAVPVALFAHSDLLRQIVDLVPPDCAVFEVAPPPEIVADYELPDDAVGRLDDANDYERWVASAPTALVAPASPPRRLLYTSGTTGPAKALQRLPAAPEQAQQMARRTLSAHGLDQGPVRALLTGSLYHSALYIYALNCVRFGQLVVIQPRFDAIGLLALLERHRISHLHLVPFMFGRLLELEEADRRRFDSGHLRVVVHGAAPCPRRLKRAMIDWWGPVLQEYYGAAEVGVIASVTAQEWLERPGTVGRPAPGVHVDILDSGRRPVTPGETGEFVVSSESSALVRFLDLTAEPQIPQVAGIGIGDMGYADAGGFLWLRGRASEAIHTGGQRVFAAEVEDAVWALPALRDCIAFAPPDGEGIGLLVEPHAGQRVDPEAVRQALIVGLGPCHNLQILHSVPRLPREDTGKLPRQRILGLLATGASESLLAIGATDLQAPG